MGQMITFYSMNETDLGLLLYVSDLKQIKIQIQDDDDKKDYWRDVVESITEEFSDILELYDIKFCISLYKP